MKKFAIHLESGVSISMISNAKSILLLDDSSQSIDNFSGVSPVKSYSGFVGQLSVLYSLSRRFQVFLQPSINVGLTQIFEGMPDRKINVVSGRTGLRMNFWHEIKVILRATKIGCSVLSTNSINLNDFSTLIIYGQRRTESVWSMGFLLQMLTWYTPIISTKLIRYFSCFSCIFSMNGEGIKPSPFNLQNLL